MRTSNKDIEGEVEAVNLGRESRSDIQWAQIVVRGNFAKRSSKTSARNFPSAEEM